MRPLLTLRSVGHPRPQVSVEDGSSRSDAKGTASPARHRRGFPCRLAPWLRLAVVLLVFPLYAADIIFSEIMYQPASLDSREEYIELHNRGTFAYNLKGWQITSGVSFTFPAAVLAPGGYLAVAADLSAFRSCHPTVTNVVGGWEGRLGDNAQTLRLANVLGEEQDEVRYASEGDWADRRRGVSENGHRGWIWYAAHDGQGRSLELINAQFSNRHGQNWRASAVDGGTPGQPNSAASANLPPVILDVAHRPVVPRSTQSVTITAQVLDDGAGPVTVALWYRPDGAATFQTLPLADDGQHGDGAAGDGVLGAVLAPRPDQTVVEFYLTATDAQGQARSWPAPVQPEGTQAANCLYQVDDGPADGPEPTYRLITTEAERQELAAMGQLPWWQSSDAQMNATFISVENGQYECHYTTGLRLRGTTTREYATKSRRVNFPNDRPWRGREAIALNAMNPHSQVMGSLLARWCGVPAAATRAVQVRENNRQWAGSAGPPYGHYAHVEVFDGNFVDQHFPSDPGGNLYRSLGDGNLQYLGEGAAAYAQFGVYAKQNHVTENDWNDLIELSRVLDQTPDADYAQEVRRVADVDEWTRYLAVNTVLANGESSLATGSRGDYALYRGESDPRFQLVCYDLDATLGLEGSTDASIFRATNNPVLCRFLTHPEFAPRYLAELRRMVSTTFAPENLFPWIDQVLGSFVPAADREAMKNFVLARNASVLSQIPSSLSVISDLPLVNWYHRTTSPQTAVHGVADPATTRRVLVAGRDAVWDALTGRWSIAGVPLSPGVNAIPVHVLDAQDQLVTEYLLTLWYDAGPGQAVSGILPADAHWTAAQGPYVIGGDLTVPAGVTLTIEPGTSVQFEGSSRLWVYGRLLAEGRPDRRIHISRPPLGYSSWGGIVFNGATNENRLTYVNMAYYYRTALAVTNSTVQVDHGVWYGSTRNVIVTTDASIAVRNSRFPDIQFDEPVGGTGIPANGFVIYEGNTFGTVTGYSDIIDFTGGKRPGPIIQILNNLFLGGSDDALDLDGTDAHIEGNVFQHFHKDNTSTSESSGIAAGRYGALTSELVIVRNVFCDNDYDMVLKEGAVAEVDHNTLVASRKGSVCFFEPERPGELCARSVAMDGNIFWPHPAALANLDTNWLAQGILDVSVDRSILSQTGPWSGEGNIDADPRFENPTNDVRLRAGSPALGAGRLGLDMGAYVPAGAALAGVPPPKTWRRDATLTVGGPGIWHYRYRLNADPWSEERTITQPIALANLADGTYQVSVIGRNSAGVWQPEGQATQSARWTVSSSAAEVRLNEVLALNRSAVLLNAGYPDLVELRNDSPSAVDLGGWSLTDDPTVPRKFVMPTPTPLAAGAYLVLIADRATNAPGLHLGFSLDASGDQLRLYDRPQSGGGLRDSVVFGLQVADRSLARTSSGEWTLGLPTFGEPNAVVPLGDPSRVRLNEWLANAGWVYRDDFIELFNPDPLPVAIGGFFLTDEPVGWPRRHALPPLSYVPASGYVVLWADGQAETGGDHLGFGLSSEQGLIGLFDRDGTLVDQVAYGSHSPDLSSGRQPSGGSTIVVFDFPTPGAAPGASGPEAGSLVINEVLARNGSIHNDAYQTPDWIELLNVSSTNLVLAGLSLTDRLDEPQRWVFPAGSILPAGGFLLVYFDSLSVASATNTGFGVGAAGDAVYLIDRPDQGGAVLDGVTFGVQALDYSIGRIPDGTGSWALNVPTPAAANELTELGDPLDLRLNEWMADPASGDDWFEVYNPGRLPVELSGLSFTDDLADPLKSIVPPLSFLGMGHGAYQVFVADSQPGQGADHVDFRISAGGESLGLAMVDGSWIDRVAFGAQDADVSEGRFPDGGSRWERFAGRATPGAPNTDDLLPQLWADVLPGRELRLRWTAFPGMRYAVETAPGMAAPAWKQVVEVTSSGYDATWVDANTPLIGARFYRVRLVP